MVTCCILTICWPCLFFCYAVADFKTWTKVHPGQDYRWSNSIAHGSRYTFVILHIMKLMWLLHNWILPQHSQLLATVTSYASSWTPLRTRMTLMYWTTSMPLQHMMQLSMDRLRPWYYCYSTVRISTSKTRYAIENSLISHDYYNIYHHFNSLLLLLGDWIRNGYANSPQSPILI